MHIDNLNNTFTIWITALQDYDFDTLLAKPDSENWSLGQVFMHLINETNFYIEQIDYCLFHRENFSEQMVENAARIFANNEFPDERIRNTEQSSQTIPNPKSKSDLFEQMLHIKNSLNLQWNTINNNISTGKTQHPGLGYFNAQEWFHFAELHLRHHLRQKQRIEQAIQYVSKKGR